jgi:hypothetical protein
MNKTSKLYLKRNEEQIKFGDYCYYSDTFSITLPCISKCKVSLKKKYYFSHTWTQNLASHPEGRIQTKLLEWRTFLDYLGLQKITKSWKSLNHEKFHNPYYSLDITDMCRSRRIRRAGNVSGVDELKNTYNIWSVKLNTSFRRHKHTRENKITTSH